MINFSLPLLPLEEVDVRLADMDRLGSRDYAEIGVPMFFVAEDLTGQSSSPRIHDGSGRILAMLLAEGVEAMRLRRADLGADDIARLIEALADRHFLSLATSPFSRAADLHPGEAA